MGADKSLIINRLIGDDELSPGYLAEVAGSLFVGFDSRDRDWRHLSKEISFEEITLKNGVTKAVREYFDDCKGFKSMNDVKDFYLDLKLILIALNLHKEGLVPKKARATEYQLRTLLIGHAETIFESIKDGTYYQRSAYLRFQQQPELFAISERVKKLVLKDSDTLYKMWKS